MQSSLADAIAPEYREQVMTSSIVNKRVLKWIKIAAAAGLGGSLLFAATVFMLSRTVKVSGKVISEETKTPIEGVMVYIHSGAPYEEEGFNSYAKTDVEGNFSATARGEVSVRAWKPGYALRGINFGFVSTVLRRDIVIELRKLTATNLVQEHDEFHEFGPGAGFSFKMGKVVSGDSSDADIIITQDVNDRTTAYIETRRDGGIIFQPWDEKIDFDNSPEAPSDGYQQRVRLIKPQEGLYFVRSQDGNHFAKFRLLVDLVKPSTGSSYLDFKSCRLIWAYQSDGTRNLELRPSEKISFPVEEFGMNRKLLKE